VSVVGSVVVSRTIDWLQVNYNNNNNNNNNNDDDNNNTWQALSSMCLKSFNANILFLFCAAGRGTERSVPSRSDIGLPTLTLAWRRVSWVGNWSSCSASMVSAISHSPACVQSHHCSNTRCYFQSHKQSVGYRSSNTSIVQIYLFVGNDTVTVGPTGNCCFAQFPLINASCAIFLHVTEINRACCKLAKIVKKYKHCLKPVAELGGGGGGSLPLSKQGAVANSRDRFVPRCSISLPL